MASYFRDHVRDMSTLTNPLHNLIKKYQKGTTIKWNEEAEQAFIKVKDEINNLPQLWFLDTDEYLESEIHLYTDASDTGIGAYLIQKILRTNPETKESVWEERPIGFMSQKLNDTQKNWSVPEREGFAILSGVKKFEHLLRDRKFHIHTDHTNLVYIKDSGSPKVIQWKLALQQYNFDCHYITGENNIVADIFSRNDDIDDCDLVEIFLLELDEIPDDKYNIIGEFHYHQIGHHGVERTLTKLQLAGYEWQYMRGHVQSFIKGCGCCQMMSMIRTPIVTRAYTTSSYAAMERLAIDTITPLPESTSGYCYILVVIDTFTRWIELYPTKNVDAETATKRLLSHCGQYGIPYMIQSDKGTQFVNEIIKEMYKVMDIKQIETTAYSKEENGIVERANLEVMRHLRNILFHTKLKNLDWELGVPMVQRIYNSTYHRSLGCSPAEMLEVL